MTDAELKDCPFCDNDDIQSGGDDKVVGYWCNNCQAHGPNEYGNYTWNDRAPSPAAVTVDRKKINAMVHKARDDSMSREHFYAIADDLCRNMADALEALTPAPVVGWRDMESAPRDTAIILYASGYYIGHFNSADDKWWTQTDGTKTSAERNLNSWNPPTHWMPLPPEPGQPATEQPDAVQEAARVLLNDPVAFRMMATAACRSRAKDDEGLLPPLFDLLDFSGENKTKTVVDAAIRAALRALTSQAQNTTEGDA